MRMRTLLPALVAGVALLLSGCGAPAPAMPAAPAAPAGNVTKVGDLEIVSSWVRPAMMGGAMDEAKPTEAAGGDHAGMGDMAMGGGANSAAYMTIRNTGSAPDKLIKAGGDVAGSIELHTMIEENGMMQMRPVEGGIEIPAGGEVQLKPGGFHVMLIGITRDLKQGEMVKLTLEFEKAGSVTIDAPVQMP